LRHSRIHRIALMLIIDGLSKRYANGVQALKNVSLTIPAGMFGLLGPNGAGKSTLMHILATLQDADSGSARLGDLDLLAQKDDVRKVLGYLPQDFGFDPRATPLSLLGLFATLKGMADGDERRGTVDGLLARVNLWEVRKRRFAELSGGMRQRFGIAVALLGAPRLLIVDEPTAGLDPAERRRFHNLLAEVAEQVVVILSTHIVEDVSDLCARVALIDKGEIVAAGSPAELTRAMEGRVWWKTVRRGDLPAQRAAHDVIDERLFSGDVVLRVHSQNRPDDSFQPASATLEDVYFHRVRREIEP
jgi:ABC-2 type transport system ATP-binding protein